MLTLTLIFVALLILSATLTLGATIRNPPTSAYHYLDQAAIGGEIQNDYQRRNYYQSPMKTYFQR